MSVFYVCFQHVWPHWVHACWWSTTLWMARTFRWRRPWKLVTPWCIPSLKSSSMRAGLKKPSLKTSYSCIKTKKTPSSSWRRRRRTPAGRSRRPMILAEVIMMSQNSMVSSSWLPLPSTRSLTTKPHDLNVFRHVESIKKNFDINHHHNSISHPSWRKIQPKWHILSNMSAISLVFSSKLSSPSTVSKTTNSHVLVVSHVQLKT